MIRSVLSKVSLVCGTIAALASTAAAHPHHEHELGAAHELMHSLGWQGHASYPMVLWIADLLILALGLYLALRSAQPRRAALGGSLAAIALLGAGLLTVAGA